MSHYDLGTIKVRANTKLANHLNTVVCALMYLQGSMLHHIGPVVAVLSYVV